MIVTEPPYDLVALFADSDTQQFFKVLLERAQEGRRSCVRPFRWRDLRDPRRDPVCHEPERDLRPFVNEECNFLIVWDRQGSGREAEAAAVSERHVVQRMESVGVSADRVLAVALEPEFERLLAPVWRRVKEVVAGERAIAAPADEAILESARARVPGLPAGFDQAFAAAPKEIVGALVRSARLRSAPALFGKIGRRVSLPTLKKDDSAHRIADAVRRWFPPIA